jgi:putative ABC transport system permease protein
MFKNYFTIAWRNLVKNRIYSIINISGLAVGMAVAMLIGLWLYDEVSYDKNFANFNRIAQVMQNQTFNGETGTQEANPAVMGEEIRRVYGSDFKHVLQATWNYDHTLTYGDKTFFKPGSCFEPGVTDMLSLKMIRGSRDGLKDINSIMLSESVAKTYFGNDDPLGKMIKVDNKSTVKVTGVYEDLPDNSSFNDLKFIMPWAYYIRETKWVQQMEDPWGSNFSRTFAQIADNADMQKVSAKIKDVKLNKVSKEDRRYKPTVFLHPMRKWHLYSEFKNGVLIGGRIDTVWMFGIIGIFVLLLACINFMNLSTARSEKRAREVGIRKAIGSLRTQLVTQFFSEAVVIAIIAFWFAICLVVLILPFFNSVAGKKITLPWDHALFWLTSIGFTVITGLIAGMYPALFLSSFNPVKVLKGTFRTGRFASLPRKMLVVSQFTISVILIIGTIVVYKQINYAQNRAVGYNRNGLISIGSTDEIHKHFETIRTELKNNGAIAEMTESRSPATGVWNTNGGFDWEGKDPSLAVDFPNNGVTHEFGKTIGWHIKEGRDFSRDYATDSAAFILNESAVKFMGFKDPIGKIIRWDGKPFTVIGVVEDQLVQSPYKPVRASLFHISNSQESVFIIRMNPSLSVQKALSKIESVFKKYNPAIPFEANFVDEEYAKKFSNEKRIGQLAAFFAILAVFISCLGLFGLASYVAEQRTKEIGIRKVLGATVSRLWQMLSIDFIVLILIACFIAIPVAWYCMHTWLQQFDYRTNIPWWVFSLTCIGALLITLLTISFQAVRAALANPVNSLRSE